MNHGMNVSLWIATLVLFAVLDSRAPAQTGSNRARAAGETGSSAVGGVQGVVKFQGEIPKARTTDDAGVRHPLLEVDRETRGLRYVVAYLTPVNPVSTPPSESPPLSPKAQATVDQQDYAFVPRVVAVREGDPVIFTNSDPANHNVRAASGRPRNEFNVFTGTGGKYEHRFVADAQNRPIQLGCDIHPWMQAWVYVFGHSHFAVTDPQGRFRINAVPPGEYKLVLQQPDVRYAHQRRLTVLGGRPTKIEVEIQAKELPQPRE